MATPLPDPNSLDSVDEILTLRASLPKVEGGHPLQAYKTKLAKRLQTVRLRGQTPISHAQARALVDAAPDECPVCGNSMSFYLSRHGDNAPINLRIICNRCNSAKGNR